MSVVTISPLFFGLRFGSSALRITTQRSRLLIRWAAQSADSSRVLMPQTFSV